MRSRTPHEPLYHYDQPVTLDKFCRRGKLTYLSGATHPAFTNAESVHGEFINCAAVGIWNRPRQWCRAWLFKARAQHPTMPVVTFLRSTPDYRLCIYCWFLSAGPEWRWIRLRRFCLRQAQTGICNTGSTAYDRNHRV